MPRLLRAAREIQCGDEETARDAVERLRRAPSRKRGVPNEQLSSRAGSLTTGSLDLVLDALADGAQRFPALRREIEGVALGWNYCNVNRLRAGPSPVNGRGLRRWGLIAGTPEERFVPELLVTPSLGGGHDSLFIRAAEQERCVPLPWAGDEPPKVVALAAPAGTTKLAWGATCPVLPPHPPRPTLAPELLARPEVKEVTVFTVATNALSPVVPIFVGPRRPIGFVGNVYLSQHLNTTTPLLGMMLFYYPYNYLFIRTGLELLPAAIPGGALNAFTYTWGIGYDDPHPGTFSLVINHWVPLRFDQVLDLPGAELLAGYKIPYPLRVGRFLATSVQLSVPFNDFPSLVITSTFKPWKDLFILVGVRLAPFEKDIKDLVTFFYGFGLFNWRPYSVSLAYYNWGRNPITALGFVDNGAVVASFSWSF